MDDGDGDPKKQRTTIRAMARRRDPRPPAEPPPPRDYVSAPRPTPVTITSPAGLEDIPERHRHPVKPPPSRPPR